jgi:hypothetical protein
LRQVVCDTGPILHLSEAKALHLLKLTGQVTVPRAVDEEAAVWIHDWTAVRPGWIRLQELQAEAVEESRGWWEAGILDQGEADALALARQIRADWFLTDDSAARLLAAQLGLEAHGSLGVVLWAAATGELDHSEAERTLEALFQSSLWISARVKSEARDALEKISER